MPYTQAIPAIKYKSVSYIEEALLKSSLKGFSLNQFTIFLESIFGKDNTQKAIDMYQLGTSKYWPGAVIFWQIDIKGRIRTGKIMLYDPVTGKRRKDTIPPIQWVHKAEKLKEFELKQCLFGEILLQNKMKPVALVESEKSAVIASILMPEFIWLASGGLDQLNDKCMALKDRTIIMFPDAGGFEKWTQKAKELSHIGNFKVSDLIERKATTIQRMEGADIADYLITQYKTRFKSPSGNNDLRTPTEKFSNKQIEDLWNQVRDYPTKNFDRPQVEKKLHPTFNQGSWTKEIEDLDKFFSALPSLDVPFRFSPWISGSSIRRYLEANLEVARAQNGNPTYRPYLNRVIELMRHLRENK